MAQTAEQWLTSYAAELGIDPPTQEQLEVLLELAGVAARASERKAAPLTCWLVATAGVEADDALSIGRRLAESDGPSAQQAGT
jgi:hypothetical protein